MLHGFLLPTVLNLSKQMLHVKLSMALIAFLSTSANASGCFGLAMLKPDAESVSGSTGGAGGRAVGRTAVVDISTLLDSFPFFEKL